MTHRSHRQILKNEKYFPRKTSTKKKKKKPEGEKPEGFAHWPDFFAPIQRHCYFILFFRPCESARPPPFFHCFYKKLWYSVCTLFRHTKDRKISLKFSRKIFTFFHL